MNNKKKKTKKLNLFFSHRVKKYTCYLTMINELFETLPEYVAFKILTYMPHKTADMIKEFWRIHYLWKRLHNIGMFRIRQDIDRRGVYAE